MLNIINTRCITIRNVSEYSNPNLLELSSLSYSLRCRYLNHIRSLKKTELLSGISFRDLEYLIEATDTTSRCISERCRRAILNRVISEVNESINNIDSILPITDIQISKALSSIPDQSKDGYGSIILPKDAILYEIKVKNQAYKRKSFKHFIKIPISNRFKEHVGLAKPEVLLPVNYSVIRDIKDKRIEEVEIIPRESGAWYDLFIKYSRPILKRNNIINDNDKWMACDIGVNNFIMCVSNVIPAFSVDGMVINKKVQNTERKLNYIKVIRDSMSDLTRDDESFFKDEVNRIESGKRLYSDYYTYQVAEYIVSKCRDNLISKVIIGYNKEWETEDVTGKRYTGSYSLPYRKFLSQMYYLCDRYSIELVLIEESYTSLSSFIDNDILPTYDGSNTTYSFKGTRITRDIYITADGTEINADVNAAFNIAKKHFMDRGYNLKITPFIRQCIYEEPEYIQLSLK